MKRFALTFALVLAFATTGFSACPYDPNCLNNPYGAGSPYKADGFKNQYSQNGSPYSNNSPNNPYATNAPKLVDEDGN